MQTSLITLVYGTANHLFMYLMLINDSMTDLEIIDYARTYDLTIITKDADFSSIALFQLTPKIIHLRIGNMKIKMLHDFLQRNWKDIEKISESHKLTNVYIDRIEGIE